MTYGATTSRVGGFPDVMGVLPAAVIADEIQTPGDARLRALFVTGGNPVLTVPDSDRLAAALPELDLLVSLDLYVNETNRHADFVLPATTFLERDDFPFALTGSQPVPYFSMTEAVVEPYGEARQEWTVFAEILQRMGLSLMTAGKLSFANPLAVALERRGLGLTPRRMMEAALRLGPYGDRFGLRRSGLNTKKLAALPHGIVLAEHAPTGIRAHAVRHRDGRIHLMSPEVRAELRRLAAAGEEDPEHPLRLIGLRELRSQNSWMHNSATLMRGKRQHSARISPADAAAHGLVDGGRVRIVSRTGAIETVVLVTDEVGPGTVAVPHGWGHDGGWRRANRSGGANVNVLSSSRPEDLEPLAGMSVLNGVRVRLEPA
jgi:formate dehydrogenase